MLLPPQVNLNVTSRRFSYICYSTLLIALILFFVRYARPQDFGIHGLSSSGPRKARVAVINTQLSHDEVIVPLLEAWLNVSEAQVTIYQAGYRFGMDDLIAQQGLPDAMRQDLHVGDFRKIGRTEKHPFPDIIVSTTCMDDIGLLNQSYTALLETYHTHLFCVLHHADRLEEENWHMETAFTPWIRADRMDFLALSSHVAEFARLEKLYQTWRVVKDELHYPRVLVFPPVFNFLPLPGQDPRGRGREAGFALQGEYQKGRDYPAVFRHLQKFIQAAKDRGESAEETNLHLVGFGRHPDVPPDLQNHVIFDERLDYIDFYTTLMQSDAVLTAFNSDDYYTMKASSSVPAALIAGTPLVGNEKLLRAYSYLNESIVWMQEDGESEMDVVERVLALSQEERDAKKAAVRSFTTRLIRGNQALARVWTRSVVDNFPPDWFLKNDPNTKMVEVLTIKQCQEWVGRPRLSGSSTVMTTVSWSSSRRGAHPTHSPNPGFVSKKSLALILCSRAPKGFSPQPQVEKSMGAAQSTSCRPFSEPSVFSAAAELKPKASNPFSLVAEDFLRLRRRWIESIIGVQFDATSRDTRYAIQRLSKTAQQELNDLAPDGSQLWSDLRPIQSSVNFRMSYDRLRTIALAFTTEGTALWRKTQALEILLRSLDFLSSEIYNASTVIGSGENWWNYKIGSTRPLIDIGILLFDELGPTRRQNYAATIASMVGDLNTPSLTGANRAHMCQVVIGAGILIEDEDEILRGRNGLSDVEGAGTKSLFTYVTSGEGFYEDGSYISHHVYPYTGGYAVSQVLALSRMLHVLQDSPYAIRESDTSMLYATIEKTFEPVMFRGMVMGHVRGMNNIMCILFFSADEYQGRNIARKSESDVDAGSSILQALVQLTPSAPEPYKRRFKSLIKSWVEALRPEASIDSNIVTVSGIENILTDDITSAPGPRGVRVMPMSDRVMFHQDNWSAAISMSSTRTGRYESLNSENLEPFYQGDGFVQLYLDNDRSHYTADYYPTMNPYHTPGVTAGQNSQLLAKYRTTAYNDWAGGLSWKGFGSASLDHLSNDRGSSAKKSWFFLLNAIISLGANCTGYSGTELHTTYESRNLAHPSTVFLVDGVTLQSNQTFMNPSWAHLSGIGGYLFLDSEAITIERANYSGRWTDIDQYPDYASFNESLTREYLTVYRNHGTDPINTSYAFALLPNTTAESTSYQASQPDFHIMSNTPMVQAILANNNHTHMATFWKPGTLGRATAHTACAVAWGCLGVQDKNYTVTISDPSQRLSSIRICIDDEDIGGVLEKDAEVIVSRTNQSSVEIDVSSASRRGQTFKVVFERLSWRPIIRNE